VQDQVAHPIGGDGAAQQPAWPQDLLLALEFLKRSGSQAIGQGGELLAQLFTAMAEQVAHAGTKCGWLRFSSII
jgi:hypothetical protein